MTRKTKELRHHHANHLHSVGHFDAGKLLNCQNVGEVVHHSPQVVDAIRVGNERMPGLSLAHLLGAAMVVANIGYCVDNLLAVKLQHYAEHSVSTRMLWAQIEEHEVSFFAATS